MIIYYVSKGRDTHGFLGLEAVNGGKDGGVILPNAQLLSQVHA